jgi:hypothetical protein
MKSGMKSVGNKMRHPLGGKKEETDSDMTHEFEEHDDKVFEKGEDEGKGPKGEKGDKPPPKEEGEEGDEDDKPHHKPPMKPDEVVEEETD